MSADSKGRYTPDQLRTKWPYSSLNELIALNEIKTAEMLCDWDTDAKKKHKERNGELDKLHKRILKELNTKTFGDVRSEQRKIEEAMKRKAERTRIAKERNSKIGKHAIPPGYENFNK